MTVYVDWIVIYHQNIPNVLKILTTRKKIYISEFKKKRKKKKEKKEAETEM